MPVYTFSRFFDYHYYQSISYFSPVFLPSLYLPPYTYFLFSSSLSLIIIIIIINIFFSYPPSIFYLPFIYLLFFS